MPQASDELRARWGGEGGVGESKAWKHLDAKGFIFTRGGMIVQPKGFDWAADTEDTAGALAFLADEWDYGYSPNAYHEAGVVHYANA